MKRLSLGKVRGLQQIANSDGVFTLREQLVIKTAEAITALPIDVLKAEFPADLHYKKDKAELMALCRDLDKSSRVPWVILSAGAYIREVV